MRKLTRTLLLFIVATFSPLVTSAQYQAIAADPASFNDVLEIGPVDGLTSTWHLAPRATAVPLGAVLKFRVESRGSVRWSGARVVEIRKGESVAQYSARVEGPHVVEVEYVDLEGERIVESCALSVVDTSRNRVTISNVRLSARPIELDDENVNSSTMSYFFSDESIAQVRQIGPSRFSMSSKRWFVLETEVDPPGFAPLVEWRYEGELIEALGEIRMRVFPPRAHTISAGLAENQQSIQVETYLVFIQSHARGDHIRHSTPVTFTAVTKPPGYEDEITWMASTKYGKCDPVMGKGPRFVTTFRDVWGQGEAWMGVKADNAIFGDDQKPTNPTIPSGECCDMVNQTCLTECTRSDGCTGEDDCTLRFTLVNPVGLEIPPGGCCGKVLGACIAECTNPNGCTGNADCSVVIGFRPAEAHIEPGGCCATVHGVCVTECTNPGGCTGNADCSVVLTSQATDAGIEPGGCCAKVHGACITSCNKTDGCTGIGDCEVVLVHRPVDGGFDFGECCSTLHGTCATACANPEGCSDAAECRCLADIDIP